MALSIGRWTKSILRFLPLIYSLLYVHGYDIHQTIAYTVYTRDESGYGIAQTASMINDYYLDKVQKILDTLNIKSERNNDEKSTPTLAQSYGYGFLAIFVISSFSLAGAVVFPLTKKPFYKYFNAFFTALAVGALFANSTFELLPAIITFQSQSKSHHRSRNSSNSSDQEPEEKGPVVPLYLWQLLMVLIVAYTFYVIEMMLSVYMNHRNREDQDKFILNNDPEGSVSPEDSPIHGLSSHRSRNDTILSATFPNISIAPEKKQTGVTAWMIIVGDGIHNVADGLAIGATFADDILVGVAQSIAIAFQELPSELGEYMILIESGFSFRQALLFNFVSACTAFIGFFVGVSISENEHARIWIFAIAAGTFTYIALVDLWPKLMPDNEEEKFDWTRFGCVTGGYLFGVLVMFGLGILTEEVVPKTSKG